MPKACPKCARPNNERAARCIYCGEVIPDRTAPSPAPEGKAPAKKGPAEVFRVMISPCQDPPPRSLEGVGKMLNLDAYSVKQKLKLPAPWVARTFPESEPAQAMVQAFINLGVDSYVIKQSGLDKISTRIQAMGLKAMADQGIVFLDGEAKEAPVRFDDVFLIVRGRIKEKPEREMDIEDDGPAVNVGKLATGGQAVPGEEKGAVREAVERFVWRPRAGYFRNVLRGQAQEIADIYRRSTPVPVRILETEFDYKGLGDEMSPSGLMNFNLIVRALEDNAKGAAIDKTFNTVGYTFGETPKQDKVRDDLTASFGTGESAKKLYDNRAYFDDFSARVYLHYLRESAKKKSQGG